MKHKEKKYRVDNFTLITPRLKGLGAKSSSHKIATHYYANQDGNDVTKLVHYGDKDEIHLLKEQDGAYSLIKIIAVEDKNAGLQWLKDNGHTATTEIKMDYTEYPYKGGLVGLYKINDSLCSVILDYPYAQHGVIESELGLDGAEVIGVPFNKYIDTEL